MTDIDQGPIASPQQDGNGDSDSETETETLNLTLQYHGEPITLTFPSSATISDLSTAISSDLLIPPQNQKFLISPRVGLLKPPFKDPSLPLSSLVDRKIQLMGSTVAEVADIQSSIQTLKEKQASRASALRAGRRVQASKSVDWKRASEEATYTFASIRPLPYLPNPSKSQRFLERLAADPGIKAAMRKHHFSVGLLTEMNPAEHTTHESRTLGLNRNRGEVIELRLRTDAGDGYRDYRVIRKTLCHELTHNVWGDHDRNFWELCKEIEAEVEKGDWTRGGRSVGGEEFYNPGDAAAVGEEDFEADEGGWTGGSYVLGASAGVDGQGAGRIVVGRDPVSRREVLARAAEERVKKQKKVGGAAEDEKGEGSSGSG